MARCGICGQGIEDGQKTWRLGDETNHQRCMEWASAPMRLEERITELHHIAKTLQTALFDVNLLGKRLIAARRKWPEHAHRIRDACERQAARTVKELRGLLAMMDRSRAAERARRRQLPVDPS